MGHTSLAHDSGIMPTTWLTTVVALSPTGWAISNNRWQRAGHAASILSTPPTIPLSIGEPRVCVSFNDGPTPPPSRMHVPYSGRTIPFFATVDHGVPRKVGSVPLHPPTPGNGPTYHEKHICYPHLPLWCLSLGDNTATNQKKGAKKNGKLGKFGLNGELLHNAAPGRLLPFR